MQRRIVFIVFVLFVLLCPAIVDAEDDLDWLTEKPVPQWIWDADGSRDGQQIYLRKSFNVAAKITSAPLYVTCDNRMTLWINGERIGASDDWSSPIIRDVSKYLAKGENTIAVRAQNDGGVAAFLFKLVVHQFGTHPLAVVSDKSWKMSTDQPGDKWFAKQGVVTGWNGRLAVNGPLGSAPWGIPGSRTSGSSFATRDLDALEGFAVDLVYEVPKSEQGSWVALTIGPDGKLIACDQGDKGAYWIEVSESDEGPSATVTPIEFERPGSNQRLSGAQGLLWAHNSLWFHRNGGHLYRLNDSDGDGELDQVETVPSQTGGGEHGNHAVIETEDGKAIYMVGGNHAPLADVTRARVTTWGEDLLVPRMWDANGHARGRLAPGGWVTRLDPNTYQQELMCIGFRNQYDVALNRYGDMFTYDADMEWDLGTPWYRPTRICHVVSGGDYGWRSGTGKWPTYFEDTLPPVVEIGPGSPTGVASGVGARFPAKYQEAIFALDWTFGTIYAIHMEPSGAGYVGTSEPFITGTPLPVTDAVIASDGALYFTVGGRGTDSALFRVRYEGNESTAPLAAIDLPDEINQARRDRRRLEEFHGRQLQGEAAQQAIDTAWPFLGSDDRFLRAAARVAIESQPVERWAERAVLENSPQSAITASVALARKGNARHQRALIHQVMRFDHESLSESQLLGMLRAVSLACIRLEKPRGIDREQMIAKLDPILPHSSDNVNAELVKLLVYLEAPSVIEKTLKLITNREPPDIPDWSEMASRNAGYGGTVQKVLDNHPPSREIGYALALRNLRGGWTIPQRRSYFEFLNEAAQGSGGASFPGFMKNIRDEALGNCSDAERIAIQDITGENYDPVPDFEIQPVEGPGRVWTIAEARSEAADRFRGASFERGRSLYFATNCGKCHRYNGLGGNIGPDLTSIPNKFDVDYVIEHIIEPSKVISDQYQSSIVLTADGRSFTGLVRESDGKTIIFPADVNAETITIDSNEIEVIRPSDVSQMPKGLIDNLSADELRDLLAYLMSGGDPKNKKVYGR